MIEKQDILQSPYHEKPNEFWNQAEVIARDAIEKTRTLLPSNDFSIRLVEREQVIQNHGHVGSTWPDGKIIQIALNPQFPDTEKLLQVELPRSVSHEMHHAVRFQTLGHTVSLKDAIIREGLAVYFEREVWGGEQSAWANALSQEQYQTILQQFQKEIQVNDTGYDHSEWFYGKGKYPLWAGYSLGYTIIKDYLDKHPKETAASLVSTPADVILNNLFSL